MAEAIRTLVDKVLLVPVNGKLATDVYGAIGTILKLAVGKRGRDVFGPDKISDGCGGPQWAISPGGLGVRRRDMRDGTSRIFQRPQH